jgi:pyruvate dehydrogenase E1 component
VDLLTGEQWRGRQRARYVMLKLLERARELQVGVPSLTATD